MNERFHFLGIRHVLAIPFLIFCAGTLHAQSVLTISGLEFDGVDDYAQANANVIPSAGDYTVCVWARADSLPAGYTEIVSQDAGTGGGPFFLGKASNGTIRICASTSVTFPKDGGWHHYAVVKAGSKMMLYLDGQLRYTRAATANPVGKVFRVGRQHTTHKEFFHGAIDELSVWGKALPLLAIHELMRARLAGNETGLRSYWQLANREKYIIRDRAGQADLTVHNLYVPGGTFKVKLPLRGSTTKFDEILIPRGRPIYALLVSGFVQNSQFDQFHFYNFAKSLQSKGAYVHYSWWNNLLAPYMERPLHQSNSVPYYWDWVTVGKAIPSEDHQFQDDARTLLQAVRKENPHAAVVLVGHSFGGDAVIRLADSLETKVPIDLLAPIDPVGNRTCMPYFQNFGTSCDNTGSHFKRFYAVRHDWFWLPTKRYLGKDIRYLYHRWQTEAVPPFDWGFHEYLDHHATRYTKVGGNARNVQAYVPTYKTGPLWDPTRLDGHGEIVGFWGFVAHKWFDANPVGLKAQNGWPAGLSATNKAARVEHMRQWDADSTYMDTHPSVSKPYAPAKPGYCMVSPDMTTILNTAINLPPIAQAGPDQILWWKGSSAGAPVSLDGSKSSEPNGTSLKYSWTGPFGKLTTAKIQPTLAPGLHRITLTVDDGTGKMDSDVVLVSVRRPQPLVAPYGLGCAGTGNLTPVLEGVSTPRVGSKDFQLRVTQAYANSATNLMIGTARTQIPLGGGCVLLVGIPSIFVASTTNAPGIGTWTLPIPNTPTLLGVRFTTQAFVVDPKGSWLNLASFTGALQCVIGT